MTKNRKNSSGLDESLFEQPTSNPYSRERDHEELTRDDANRMFDFTVYENQLKGKLYIPPEIIPEGWVYKFFPKYDGTGKTDHISEAAKIGWRPVRRADHKYFSVRPEFEGMTGRAMDHDFVEVQGNFLLKIEQAKFTMMEEYYQRRASSQLKSVPHSSSFTPISYGGDRPAMPATREFRHSYGGTDADF